MADKVDNLYSDEERSSESSSRSGDVSGLFENQESIVKQEINGSVREFSEVLTLAPSGVSILINSGNRTDGIQGSGMGTGGPLNQEDLDALTIKDDGTGRSSLSHFAAVVPETVLENRELTGEQTGYVSRGVEGNSHAPNSNADQTITENFGNNRSEPSAGGQRVPVSGRSDKPRELLGGKTQTLPAMRSRAPPASSDVNNHGGTSQPHGSQRNPHQSQEKGEVDNMGWEQVPGNKVEDMFEDVQDNSVQAQLYRLCEEEEAAQDQLTDLLHTCATISRKKSTLLEQLDPGVGEAREALLRPSMNGGTVTALINVEARAQERMYIAAGDLTVRATEAWKDSCDVLQAALYQPALTFPEIEGTMSRIADTFQRGGKGSVGPVVTPDQWEQLRARHSELARLIVGRSRISLEAQRMFPRVLAKDIVSWYHKLEVALDYLEKQRSELNQSSAFISGMLDEYPGPDIQRPEEMSRGSGSASGSRGSFVRPNKLGPGSVGSRQGGGRHQIEANQPRQGPPSLTLSEVRRVAADAGHNWRMGGGLPINALQHPVDNGGVGNGGPGGHQLMGNPVNSNTSVNSVPISLINRIQNGTEDRRGDGSEYEYEDSVWHGETDGEIKDRIRTHAQSHLEARGKLATSVLDIVMDNLPPFRWTRTKNQHSIIRSFTTVTKNIKPACSETYINTNEWWKMFNRSARDYQWNIGNRIRCLAINGGLPSTKEYLLPSERMRTMMEQIKVWMPRYDENVDELDFEYWVFVWVDITLHVIEEFHQIQPMEMVEQGLLKYMQQPEYLINQDDDEFLNTQFHKVSGMYVAMNVWLRERSSPLVNTPLWGWQTLVRWLEKQSPGGGMMMIHIRDALRKLSTNPESVMPVNLPFTQDELRDIRILGADMATEKVYALILQHLKNRALLGDLKLSINSMAQMASLVNKAAGAKAEPKAGRQGRSTNSVHTDGVSAMTLNSTVSGSGGGGSAPAKTYKPCQHCSLFHQAAGDGKCKLVKADGQPDVKGLLGHRSLVLIRPDGSKGLSEYWEKKLHQFYFPKLGLSQTKVDKVLAELRKEIAKLPKAGRTETEKFAKAQILYANLAKMEDNTHIKTLNREVNVIVSHVNNLGGRGSSNKEGKSKSGSGSKVKQLRIAEEANSEQSSDEEGSEWDSEEEN
jgi:hypothetical protein